MTAPPAAGEGRATAPHLEKAPCNFAGLQAYWLQGIIARGERGLIMMMPSETPARRAVLGTLTLLLRGLLVVVLGAALLMTRLWGER